jgi:hypothetical protein
MIVISRFTLGPLYGPVFPLWPLFPDYHYKYVHSRASLHPYVLSTASVPSMGLCSLVRPSVPSTASYLYGPLSPLQPFAPSTAPLHGPLSSLTLCFLNSPLYPLRPSVPLRLTVLSWPFVYSTAICPSRKPYVSSTFFCHLYGHLTPLWPSSPSMALCSLYSPLSSLWSSVSSKALCPLHCPLPPL